MNRPAFLFLFFFSLYTIACRRDLPAKSEEETAVLRCIFDSLNLQYALFLQAGEVEIKLADLSTCTDIPVSAYPLYQVPDNAQSAFFGRQGNEIAFFFLNQSSEVIRIYRARTTEAQIDPPVFQPYASYKDGKFTFQKTPE